MLYYSTIYIQLLAIRLFDYPLHGVYLYISGSWEDSITLFGPKVVAHTWVGNCRIVGKEEYFNPLCYFCTPKWISIKLAFSGVNEKGSNVTCMSCGSMTGWYKGKVDNIHFHGITHEYFNFDASQLANTLTSFPGPSPASCHLQYGCK